MLDFKNSSGLRNVLVMSRVNLKTKTIGIFCYSASKYFSCLKIGIDRSKTFWSPFLPSCNECCSPQWRRTKTITTAADTKWFWVQKLIVLFTGSVSGVKSFCNYLDFLLELHCKKYFALFCTLVSIYFLQYNATFGFSQKKTPRFLCCFFTIVLIFTVYRVGSHYRAS